MCFFLSVCGTNQFCSNKLWRGGGLAVPFNAVLNINYTLGNIILALLELEVGRCAIMMKPDFENREIWGAFNAAHI